MAARLWTMVICHALTVATQVTKSTSRSTWWPDHSAGALSRPPTTDKAGTTKSLGTSDLRQRAAAAVNHWISGTYAIFGLFGFNLYNIKKPPSVGWRVRFENIKQSNRSVGLLLFSGGSYDSIWLICDSNFFNRETRSPSFEYDRFVKEKLLLILSRNIWIAPCLFAATLNLRLRVILTFAFFSAFCFKCFVFNSFFLK